MIIPTWPTWETVLIIKAFSVNYFIPEADMTLQDPDSTLKIFEDSKTASGNIIQVC